MKFIFTNHDLSLQFAPEEYLYRAGEAANEMYFIVSGSVEEVSETSEVRLKTISASTSLFF